MRVKEIKLYQFNELSDAAKEVAIGKNSEINVDYQWWEFTYEDAAQIGLKTDSFDLCRGSYVNGNFTLSAAEVAANILSAHGESCDTFKTTTKFMEEWQPIFNRYMETEKGEDELLEIEEQFLKDICEDYRIILQNEYEYLTSSKAIYETLIANEYEFTEEGIINY